MGVSEVRQYSILDKTDLVISTLHSFKDAVRNVGCLGKPLLEVAVEFVTHPVIRNFSRCPRC
jgi:hypothetical protein